MKFLSACAALFVMAAPVQAASLIEGTDFVQRSSLVDASSTDLISFDYGVNTVTGRLDGICSGAICSNLYSDTVDFSDYFRMQILPGQRIESLSIRVLDGEPGGFGGRLSEVNLRGMDFDFRSLWTPTPDNPTVSGSRLEFSRIGATFFGGIDVNFPALQDLGSGDYAFGLELFSVDPFPGDVVDGKRFYGRWTMEFVITEAPAAPVPLPAAGFLLLGGLGGLAALRRRRAMFE